MTEKWERDVLKHVFILTDSGKPIFSLYGDEQELSTIFSLVQAIISIVQDSGDELLCMKAGSRKTVFVIKGNIYLVAITSTDEPEAIIRQQLDFLYSLILMILTSRVHDLLRVNASRDLRDLLGPDTSTFLRTACNQQTSPTYIGLNALNSFVLHSASERVELEIYLRKCMQFGSAV